MDTKRYKSFIKGMLFGACMLLAGSFMISCEAVSTDPPFRPVKSKTILVYMAGNNNLSFDAVRNIQEMENGFVPYDEEGNLVVFSHTLNAKPKLIRLYKNGDGRVIRDTVYNFPDMNSATAAAVTSAIKVTTTLFPADENGLILWSHATGWLPAGYYASGTFQGTAASRTQEGGDAHVSPWPAYPGGIDPFAGMVKSFGADNSSTSEIEITDLAKALPHKFNFIIFDACLLGGVEVAYQFKDSTDYMVFSPAEVLSTGFAYKGMMSYLFKNPTDLKGMAENVYNYYNSQPDAYYRAATVAVVKSSELPAVAQAARQVFDKYRDRISDLDMKGIQRYFRSDKHWFYDVNDFIDQIAGTQGAADAAQFKSALEKAVIYKAATAKFLDIMIDPSKYSGVSTYIPNPYNEQLVEFYRKFDWEKAVGMTMMPTE